MIRLLIADDSALMRKLLEGIFTAEGDFDIRMAYGNEARTGSCFRPQVVTLMSRCLHGRLDRPADHDRCRGRSMISR